MKRGIKKKNTSIYQFLEPYIASGNEESIAKARKEYWNAYKAAWRKKQRQETREITVVLTLEEAKDLADAAKRHRRSMAQFIKQSSLAYLSKQYLVPDVAAINAIRQLLALNYNILKKLFDENRLSYEDGTSLLEQMNELERNMLMELSHPTEIPKP